MVSNRYFLGLFLGFFIFLSCGCDAVYSLLQKEGAEEKELLGEIIPYQSNSKVEKIQKLLKLYGYKPGNPDGKMGINTRNAVEKFQEDSNLKVNRFVDKPTWKKLHELEELGLVKNGGINGGKLQQALKKAGFNPGKMDGKMGPQTLTAIKNFQKANGLKPDGAVGYKTLILLDKYL